MPYAGDFVDFGAIPKDQSYGMGIRDVRGRFRSEGRGRVILCGLLAIMSDRPDAGIDVNVFPFRQVCRECASIGLPADSFQRFLKKSLVRRAIQYSFPLSPDKCGRPSGARRLPRDRTAEYAPLGTASSLNFAAR